MEEEKDMSSVFLTHPDFIKMREKAEIALRHLQENYEKNKEYERDLKTFRDWYATLMTERREGFAEGYAAGLTKA